MIFIIKMKFIYYILIITLYYDICFAHENDYYYGLNNTNDSYTHKQHNPNQDYYQQQDLSGQNTNSQMNNQPQQNYPQQNYPQQNYPQQNYPQQNYPQQNYPQQNYPNTYYNNYPGIYGAESPYPYIPYYGYGNNTYSDPFALGTLMSLYTPCSEMQSMGNKEQFRNTLKFLSGVSAEKIINQQNLYSIMDNIYDFCAHNPNHMVKDALASVFPTILDSITSAFHDISGANNNDSHNTRKQYNKNPNRKSNNSNTQVNNNVNESSYNNNGTYFSNPNKNNNYNNTKKEEDKNPEIEIVS